MDHSNSDSISLGWNCNSACTGLTLRLRVSKAGGYQTCPFDMMITNYKGIIECIKDDFKYLCDTKYIELIKIPQESKWLNTHGGGDFVIYNNKYKFIFNHESPGHADLFITQGWAKGIDHYMQNDYEEFKNRYNRRIKNIKNLLNSGKYITFILTRPKTKMEDITELNDLLILKYPLLKFGFIFTDREKEMVYDHLLLMRIDKDDEEVTRLL